LIPLPVILAEIVMALGGALCVANVWALVQPKVRPDRVPARPVHRGRAITNAIIGFVVLIWGFASFITKI
jgi:fumarate reductase subunit C